MLAGVLWVATELLCLAHDRKAELAAVVHRVVRADLDGLVERIDDDAFPPLNAGVIRIPGVQRRRWRRTSTYLVFNGRFFFDIFIISSYLKLPHEPNLG